MQKDKKFYMGSYVKSTKELFEEYIFQIPFYQRPYSWGKIEIKEFIHDIFKKMDSIEKNNDLYFGAIFSIENLNDFYSNCQMLELVDGQQRMTTISLIFLASYSLIKTNDSIPNDIKNVLENILWKKKNKEKIVINSANTMESKIILELFNNIYDNENIYDFLDKKYSNKFEEKIIFCIKYIFEEIEKILKKQNKFFEKFIEFILSKTFFNLVIINKDNKDNINIYEIFESINSKGKHLIPIDLIKTHIFSKIDESKRNEYLKKWGKLTIDTEDRLQEYLLIYIRSFIKYSDGEIKLSFFKKLEKDKNFQIFFKKENISDIYELLIDDLSEKMKYYLALYNENKFKEIITCRKTLFYWKCFNFLAYKHPKSLLFKSIFEFDNFNNKNRENNILKIFKYLFSYSYIFLTISDKDSKTLIPFFKSSIKYDGNQINSNYIRENVLNEFKKNNLNWNEFKNILEDNYLAYSNKREITNGTFIFLNIINSLKPNIFSYDNANKNLDDKLHDRNLINIDHILPKNPKNNNNFEYQIIDSNGEKILKFSDDHTFNSKKVKDGMNYNDFLNTILNRMPNLRLINRDENVNKSNNLDLELSTYSKMLEEWDNNFSKLKEFNIFLLE